MPLKMGRLSTPISPEKTPKNNQKSRQGGIFMFVKFKIPEKASTAIRGLKPYQQAKVLKLIEDKIRLLFIENSHNIYSDIHNYASFDGFLGSLAIIKNDGSDIVWFYDEEILRETEDIKNSEFENNLFGGNIETKPLIRDSYINKLMELDERNHNKFEDYFSNKTSEFWKDFSKEGR